MKSKFLLLIAAFALPLCMWANNIRVKLNSYNPTTKQLNISLAWDNSWHDGSGQFRDGAWLFVKYKDVSNNTWQHAILNTPANTATITDTLSGYNVMFNVIGKNPSTASGYVGSRGYIIRRQQGATATVQSNPEYAGVYNVAMNLTATIVTPPGMLLANPEFRVYAMEVVNIPSGAYYAGDGSYNSIVQTSTTNNSPVYIANENTPVTIAGQAVSQGYPKATYEYFMLKYEVSNEAFVEFLNTLPRSFQNDIVHYDLNTATSGNVGAYGAAHYGQIAANVTSLTEPAVFGCDANNNGVFNEANDGANRGVLQDYAVWGAYYLDWAGMRLMTGYEYEKACRGPLYPIAGEHAWGSPERNQALMDIDVNGPNESSSLVVNGPSNGIAVRNGAYAKPTGSTRLNSGGSYYGIMELSNSLAEPISGYTTDVPVLGDGILSSVITTGSVVGVGSNGVSLGGRTYLLTASYTLGYVTGAYPALGIRGVIK